MVDLVGAVRGAVRGGVCIALDGIEGLAAIAAAISNDSDTERAFREANAIRCLYCGDSNCPEDDFPEPAFTGGQCSVNYNITSTIQLSGAFCGDPPPPSVNTALGVPGPISAPFPNNSAFGGANVCPGFAAENVAIRDGNGNIQILGGSAFGSELISISVSRADGQPDDCGSPDPVFPDPPSNTEYNVDITFDDVFGVEVTVPITVNYSPTTVNFNGNLTVPFTVEISPTFAFRGNVNLNTGDVNFNFTGNFNPGRTDEDPIVEPPPENAPQDPTPEDLEEGFGIAGVFVYSFRTLPRTAETQIPSNIAPTLLVPRIGSVQFEILGGDLRGWLPDIDIKSVSTFIPCPVEWGASRVVVRWDEGWSGQFIPLYRDLPVI